MRVKLRECKVDDAVLLRDGQGGLVTKPLRGIVYTNPTDKGRVVVGTRHGTMYLDPDTKVTLLAPVAETWRAACEAIHDGLIGVLFGEAIIHAHKVIETIAANPKEPQ